MEFLIKAGQLILSLSILIVLHEFGHYLPARWFKTRVEKFYLFFDYKFSLFKKKIGDTEWGIGWIPLGGYVKISGMIDESMDKEQMKEEPKEWEFRTKPAWQRLIIMVGGVVVNMILGILIYIMVLFTWGEDILTPEAVENGYSFHTYYQELGFQNGDDIVTVDGEELRDVMDINRMILLRDAREIKVNRDGEEITITLPEEVDMEAFKEGAMQGIIPRFDTTIDSVHNDTPGNEAGLLKGDQIVSLNGVETPFWNDFTDELRRLRDHFIDSDSEKIPLEEEIVDPLPDAVPGRFDTLAEVIDQNAILAESQPIVSEEKGKFKTKEIIEIDSTGKPVKSYMTEIQVSRNGELLTMEVVTDSTFILGVAPVAIRKEEYTHIDYSFGESIPGGISLGVTTLSDYVSQLKFLFTSKGASSIGGFGTFGSLFSPTWDWQVFWTMTAFISIMLAFMNILPIPALDGGHIIFLLYEMISGRKPNEKVMEYAQLAGIILILGLVLFANGNDIYRYVFGG